MWVYRLNSCGPAHKRLELLPAQSRQYDRLLQQYNMAEPKPQQVKRILEEFGRPKEQELKNSSINILKIVEPDKGNLDD